MSDDWGENASKGIDREQTLSERGMPAWGGFTVGASVLLWVTCSVGGWAWGVMCGAALVMQAAVDRRLGITLLGIVPSLFWMAFALKMDNRELYFPYTMLLAAHATLLVSLRGVARGFFAGQLLVLTFVAVRVVQGVTAKVLTVELVVATAVLAAVLWMFRQAAQSPLWRAVIAVWASLIAFAGLAL